MTQSKSDDARPSGEPDAGDVEALTDALAPLLYEAIMERIYDQWRQWYFLTNEARQEYRRQTAEMLLPAVLAALPGLGYVKVGPGQVVVERDRLADSIVYHGHQASSGGCPSRCDTRLGSSFAEHAIDLALSDIEDVAAAWRDSRNSR